MKNWDALEYFQVSETGKIMSKWMIVNENGVLCQAIRHLGYWVYYPILWHSYETAKKFIETGHISDVQEGAGNLHVEFVNTLIKQDGQDQDDERPLEHIGPPPNLTIDELFMFCAKDGPGMEGLISAEIKGFMVPLMGADMDRIKSLMPKIRKIQKETGKKIILKRFKLISEEDV